MVNPFYPIVAIDFVVKKPRHESPHQGFQHCARSARHQATAWSQGSQAASDPFVAEVKKEKEVVDT